MYMGDRSIKIHIDQKKKQYIVRKAENGCFSKRNFHITHSRNKL